VRSCFSLFHCFPVETDLFLPNLQIIPHRSVSVVGLALSPMSYSSKRAHCKRARRGSSFFLSLFRRKNEIEKLVERLLVTSTCLRRTDACERGEMRGECRQAAVQTPQRERGKSPGRSPPDPPYRKTQKTRRAEKRKEEKGGSSHSRPSPPCHTLQKIIYNSARSCRLRLHSRARCLRSWASNEVGETLS
jgi:hypothetical protein